MKRIRNWTAGALALILSLTLIVPALAEDTTTEEITEVSLTAGFGQTDARAMLQMVNNFRTGDEAYYWNETDTEQVNAKGEPLVYSYALEEIAMQRAIEAALKFAHERPDGTMCFTVIASNGARTYAENISLGSLDPAGAFEGLKEDGQPYSGQGHRRNMLNTGFKAMGVGHAILRGINDDGEEYAMHVWTHEFSYETDSAPETTPLDGDKVVTIPIATSQLQRAKDLTATPASVSVEAGQNAVAPVVSAAVKLNGAWLDYDIPVTVSAPVWNSGDETVATVSGQQITGVKAGSVTLTGAALGRTISVPVTVTSGEAQTPVLALSNTPLLGEASRFEGAVYVPGADLDPTAYGVALYIQPDDSPTYWYKPDDDAGLSPLSSRQTADKRAAGEFSVAYYSEGENAAADRNSKYVHLLVLPAGETPKSANFADMREKALCAVTVTRTSDGAAVSPKYDIPVFQLGVPGKDPGLTVSPGKIMLDVGFHTDGSALGSTLSVAHILKHLKKLVGWADPLRFYSCADSLRVAYQAAHDMEFTVVATANLTADDTENLAELDRAAELLNSGLAKICAVGNETLLHKTFYNPGDTEDEAVLKEIRERNAAQLLSYIEYLRGKVTRDDVYITTAEDVHELLRSEADAVRDACDFLFMHDYPYYGGVDPDKQLAALSNDYQNLKAKNNNPDFKVYIGETGYPSGGETVGNAAASEQEAARYFEAVRQWAIKEDAPAFTFSAFDESGKTGNEAEKHFGLISVSEDGGLKLKPAYGQLDSFQSVAAKIYGNSLSLRGNIGINFYLTLPRNLTFDLGAYVTINGEKFLIRDAEHGGIDDDPYGEYYKFTWTVPAKRMNDPVTIQIFNVRDVPYLLLDRNGVDYTDGYTYSVADYLKQARGQYESGALRELVDAMSDYGSFAQTFFKYDTDSAATVTSAIASVSADNFAAYEPQIAQTENAGISYAGSNLTLESETTLRHFFKLESGHSVSEYAFTVDGTSVTPVSRSEGYCVEIPDIVAKNLGKSYAVTVSLTSGGDAVTITNYSALSYGYRALNNSTDEALLNLVKALYLYNRKADAYFTA